LLVVVTLRILLTHLFC